MCLAVKQIVRKNIKGGSTVLLGQLTGSMLTVINLGDSGILVLRPMLRARHGGKHVVHARTVFRSAEQTHYFNCPYQISHDTSHRIEEPDNVHLCVRAGDLIIAASDGVFDNIFDVQLQAMSVQVLEKIWRSGSAFHMGMEVESHLQLLAKKIVASARAIGEQEKNPRVKTPFAEDARREKVGFIGGKLDDIAVVVGLAVELRGQRSKLVSEAQSTEKHVLPRFHNFDTIHE